MLDVNNELEQLYSILNEEQNRKKQESEIRNLTLLKLQLEVEKLSKVIKVSSEKVLNIPKDDDLISIKGLFSIDLHKSQFHDDRPEWKNLHWNVCDGKTRVYATLYLAAERCNKSFIAKNNTPPEICLQANEIKERFKAGKEFCNSPDRPSDTLPAERFLNALLNDNINKKMKTVTAPFGKDEVFVRGKGSEAALVFIVSKFRK